MLKVSVVVPVYDPGEYFGPCIDSLITQSLPPDEFEIICVDDGSTDDTPARLDELAATHRNIHVIHQPNSGWPGQPRNVGIDAARGEYVFFCDHDDWLGAEALERLYEFATSCDSDIVLPKMAGLQRRIPRVVFTETIRECVFAFGDHGQPDAAQVVPPGIPEREAHSVSGRSTTARRSSFRRKGLSAREGCQHLRRLHLLLPHPARGHGKRGYRRRTGRATSTILPKRSRSPSLIPSRALSAIASFGGGFRSRWCNV